MTGEETRRAQKVLGALNGESRHWWVSLPPAQREAYEKKFARERKVHALRFRIRLFGSLAHLCFGVNVGVWAARFVTGPSSFATLTILLGALACLVVENRLVRKMDQIESEASGAS